jgi:sporulation protein YlmC with PRC-barrel domain
MLRSARELNGYTIQATDGEVGSVSDLLFDDEHWTVRYLVVDTGGWLPGREVLISPISFGRVDWSTRRFHVQLTRKQVEDSPGIEADMPVSRQHEGRFYGYYGWPVYWGGAGIWGPYMYPGPLLPPPGALPAERRELVEQEEEQYDSHLRSSREVTGYGVQARDGDIGHVEDFLLDDESWQIRYLAVDTVNWWPGKKVLLPPEWLGEVSWIGRSVSVDLLRRTIQNAPEWDPSRPLGRRYEQRLHDYYGRKGYWERQGLSRAA